MTNAPEYATMVSIARQIKPTQAGCAPSAASPRKGALRPRAQVTTVNRTIVVPDVHEQPGRARAIMDAFPAERYVFVGDYFDTFGPHRVPETIEFLLEMIERPNVRLLVGNHDMQYLFPGHRGQFMCSGFRWQTADAVEASDLVVEVGDKFHTHAILTARLPIAVTHAGFTGQRVRNIHASGVLALLAKTNRLLYEGLVDQDILKDVGHARGGYRPCGGILWCDWRDEFEPIEGLRQIVGHTPGYKPRQQGDNWCIDTDLRHVAIVDNETGVVTIEETRV